MFVVQLVAVIVFSADSFILSLFLVEKIQID